MEQFKHKYNIGARIRYKHHFSNNSQELYVIKDVCCEEKNNYCYYEVIGLAVANELTPFIDCKLLEDNTESFQEIRKEKLKKINNIYQYESKTIL